MTMAFKTLALQGEKSPVHIGINACTIVEPPKKDSP